MTPIQRIKAYKIPIRSLKKYKHFKSDNKLKY